jgi:short subunit fatty acids transporter
MEEDNTKLLESLLDKAKEYAVTTIELARLKAVDKAADVVSSFLPVLMFIIFMATFLLFLNLGLSLWLGEILGRTFYGFFIVSGFYLLVGIIIRFLFYNSIKRMIGDYFVKHVLK